MDSIESQIPEEARGLTVPETAGRQFQLGENIRVQRSSGDVEDGWEVGQIDEESQIVRVINRELNLKKDIPMIEVRDWQKLPLSKHAARKVKVEPQEVDSEASNLNTFEQSEQNRANRYKKGLPPIDELDENINHAEYLMQTGDPDGKRLFEHALAKKRNYLVGKPTPAYRPPTQPKRQRG